LFDLTSKIAPVESAGEDRGSGHGFMILAGSVALPALWTLLEYTLWSMPPLPNKAPELDAYGCGRSALTILLSLGALAAFARRAPAPKAGPLSLLQMSTVAVSLAFLGAFLAMFLLSPAAFSQASLEDGPVEWASAAMPLAASFLLLWRGGQCAMQARPRPMMPWTGATLIFCAAVLFVLGMEEISWMQRIFGFHTPHMLDRNIQHELNLHNLATNQIGTVHKLMGFALLVLLPFIHATAPQVDKVRSLSPLIPSRSIALVSAPLAALNYNGWDLLPMQMTTYLTVGIVLYLGWQARRRRRHVEEMLCIAMAVTIVVAQILFIDLGDRFARIWDITEYKELYIAFGLFAWAMEVFNRLGALRAQARSARKRSARA
jgi:hypothetical protein